MDKSLAIQATNLSKKYRLGTIGMTSLREDLSRWWNRNKNEIAKNDSNQAGIEHSRMINDHEFWALHDLNFDIAQGEVVGLIGANGSGKSTLLKILSRITEPTTGEVRIRGKVASLLEVGTGFHPELTGRENVYINGAILGMTRREVKTKFDEIVNFAGVADFIDTPIKRYSSGMTVRLGFAVAAHLDPDILIVDEVLAVGDAAFQKKCIGKMKSISSSGRTVIFVSHNLSSVQALCNRCILLQNGRLLTTGNTEKVIDYYLSESANNQFIQALNDKKREGTGEIQLISMCMRDSRMNEINSIRCGQNLTFEFKFKNLKSYDFTPVFAVSVKNENGTNVTWLNSKLVGQEIDIGKNGILSFHIERLNLTPGRYFLNTFIGNFITPVDWIVDAYSFDVHNGAYYETGRLPPNGQALFLSNFTAK
jgi:lipopolysaccharide transport system ATP-binding protein